VNFLKLYYREPLKNLEATRQILYKEKKMKNHIKFFGITAIALVIGLFTISCDVEPPEDEKVVTTLGVPSNITIVVTGRTMVVTWDAVPNASGYEIITYSEGCGSGKRKINTKEITAVSYNPDAVDPNPIEGTTSVLNSVKTDGTQANGSVIILAKNKIQITLMPNNMEGADPNLPMASAVTAKVKALGEVISGNGYSDSDYSSVVRQPISGGMGGM